MNCIYRSIWNETTGTFVAASENASSAGKRNSSGPMAISGQAHFVLRALAVCLALGYGAVVYALPAGGVVAAGAATIGSAGGTTTIRQTTQNAVINWQSFNIGAREGVLFVQPNRHSVALNRVLGADPSSLLGSLSANGKVFLINPNGILFGQGASVNVGGLVASTLNLSDADFMAGKYRFSGEGGASILNQGSIKADAGYVALLGANVSNEGVISARLGSVALAAGERITLDVAGDGLLNVTVNQAVVDALVRNGGLIRADGGQVLMTHAGGGQPAAGRGEQHRRGPGADDREPRRHDPPARRHAGRFRERGRHAGRQRPRGRKRRIHRDLCGAREDRRQRQSHDRRALGAWSDPG